MSRYRRTSSVGAMLEKLNWEPLASRRRTARLVLFHKIRYGLVAINMPLELKHNSGPTQTENTGLIFLDAIYCTLNNFECVVDIFIWLSC